MTAAPNASSSGLPELRQLLLNAIDSTTVSALAEIFKPQQKLLSRGYSEQIIDVLLPRFVALRTPALPSGQAEGMPVAWRCKDYSDGWIIYQDEVDALAYHAATDCLIQPLFATSPTQITGEVREDVKNIINRLVVVKERWDGLQILEGLDEAADAILAAISPQPQAGENPTAPEPGWLAPALEAAAERAAEMPDWMTRTGDAAQAVRETCVDCGKNTPCDDECPNFIEPGAEHPANYRKAFASPPAPLPATEEGFYPTHGDLLAEINKAAHAAGTNAWVRDVLRQAHRAIRRSAPIPSTNSGDAA